MALAVFREAWWHPRIEALGPCATLALCRQELAEGSRSTGNTQEASGYLTLVLHVLTPYVGGLA